MRLFCYVVVDVAFVVVVVINVDFVVSATSKVDLRLLVMEVEFGWVVGGVRWWLGGWVQKLCWVVNKFVR